MQFIWTLYSCEELSCWKQVCAHRTWTPVFYLSFKRNHAFRSSILFRELYKKIFDFVIPSRPYRNYNKKFFFKKNSSNSFQQKRRKKTDLNLLLLKIREKLTIDFQWNILMNNCFLIDGNVKDLSSTFSWRCNTL